MFIRKPEIFLEGENGGGGGGGPTLEQLQAELAKTKAELDAAKKAAPPPKAEDKSLLDKVNDDRKSDADKEAEASELESAILFEANSGNFLKENEGLVPPEFADIFEKAKGEKWANRIQKDRAIKSNMIQAYFKHQANIDQLTPSQKKQIDGYLGLTKDGKEEKAQTIYDAIFEPTLEAVRKVKKAEALRKGLSVDKSGDAHENKMVQHSKKHHRLGDLK